MLWPASAAGATGIGGNGTVANGIVTNAVGTGGKGSVANPALTRVIWFLLTYYVFIIIHRVLRARGIVVFRVREATA